MKKLPVQKNLQTMRYAATNYIAKECIYPFYASFKVTHVCSLKCSFCNVWREKTPDLKKENVFRVIDNIANSSIVVLSLEGGDPLVRKDLGEILLYAHQKPIYRDFVVGGRPSRDYYRIADRWLRGAVEAARLEASDRAAAAEHRARAEEARGELLRATEVLP